MRWEQRNIIYPQVNRAGTNTVSLMRNGRNKTSFNRTMRSIQTSQKNADNKACGDSGNARSPLRLYSHRIMSLFIKVLEILRQNRKTNITKD